MEAAHALRDGTAASAASEIEETYDLVVVGAGMSGLSAAYYYRKALPNSKVLVLEACDDFGGHARRNEYNVAGRQLIAAGGTYMIMFPNTYTPEGKSLLADIGIDPQRFYKAASQSYADSEPYHLTQSAFFDKNTFGVDKLVVNARDFTLPAAAAGPTWHEFLARTPLSMSAKKDIQRLVEDRQDHLPGSSSADKIKWLRGQSYADFSPAVDSTVCDMRSVY